MMVGGILPNDTLGVNNEETAEGNAFILDQHAVLA